MMEYSLPRAAEELLEYNIYCKNSTLCINKNYSEDHKDNDVKIPKDKQHNFKFEQMPTQGDGTNGLLKSLFISKRAKIYSSPIYTGLATPRTRRILRPSRFEKSSEILDKPCATRPANLFTSMNDSSVPGICSVPVDRRRNLKSVDLSSSCVNGLSPGHAGNGESHAFLDGAVRNKGSAHAQSAQIRTQSASLSRQISSPVTQKSNGRRILQFFSRMKRTKSSTKLDGSSNADLSCLEGINLAGDADGMMHSLTPISTEALVQAVSLLGNQISIPRHSVDQNSTTDLSQISSSNNFSSYSQNLSWSSNITPSIVRPLHPSLIENCPFIRGDIDLAKYCFQVTSFENVDADTEVYLRTQPVYLYDSSGQNRVVQKNKNNSNEKQKALKIISRIYSCVSSADRDNWIRNINGAINPNRDFERRTENRLTLWIQEIKGVPKRKRYFCDLLVDSVLYARTGTKTMNDMLLFGEEFDLSGIPDAKTVEIQIWSRVGDGTVSSRSNRLSTKRDRSFTHAVGQSLDMSSGMMTETNVSSSSQRTRQRSSSSALNHSQLLPSQQAATHQQQQPLTVEGEQLHARRQSTSGMDMYGKRYSVPDGVDRQLKKKKMHKKSANKGASKTLIATAVIPISQVSTTQEQEDWHECITAPNHGGPSASYSARKAFSITNSSPSNHYASSTGMPSNGGGTTNTSSLSSSGVGSNGGIQVRVKARYRSLRVLPRRHYTRLERSLLSTANEVMPLLRELEPWLGVRMKADLAAAFVGFHHCGGDATNFLVHIVLSDIRQQDPSMVLRGNTLASKAIESYIRLVGEEYLKRMFGDLFHDLCSIDVTGLPTKSRTRRRPLVEANCAVNCEVDPTRLTGKSITSDLSRNQQNLLRIVHLVWNYIYDSRFYFPPQLKSIFAAIRNNLEQRMSDTSLTSDENNSKEFQCTFAENAISACIFLRFICPAILNPSLFGLTSEFPENVNLIRTLTLVAKTIQSLANLRLLGSAKEPYMSFLNEFVSTRLTEMRRFLWEISVVGQEEASSADAMKETTSMASSMTTGGGVSSSKSMHAGLNGHANGVRLQHGAHNPMAHSHINGLNDAHHNHLPHHGNAPLPPSHANQRSAARVGLPRSVSGFPALDLQTEMSRVANVSGSAAEENPQLRAPTGNAPVNAPPPMAVACSSMPDLKTLHLHCNHAVMGIRSPPLRLPCSTPDHLAALGLAPGTQLSSVNGDVTACVALCHNLLHHALIQVHEDKRSALMQNMIQVVDEIQFFIDAKQDPPPNWPNLVTPSPVRGNIDTINAMSRSLANMHSSALPMSHPPSQQSNGAHKPSPNEDTYYDVPPSMTSSTACPPNPDALDNQPHSNWNPVFNESLIPTHKLDVSASHVESSSSGYHSFSSPLALTQHPVGSQSSSHISSGSNIVSTQPMNSNSALATKLVNGNGKAIGAPIKSFDTPQVNGRFQDSVVKSVPDLKKAHAGSGSNAKRIPNGAWMSSGALPRREPAMHQGRPHAYVNLELELQRMVEAEDDNTSPAFMGMNTSEVQKFAVFSGSQNNGLHTTPQVHTSNESDNSNHINNHSLSAVPGPPTEHVNETTDGVHRNLPGSKSEIATTLSSLSSLTSERSPPSISQISLSARSNEGDHPAPNRQTPISHTTPLNKEPRSPCHIEQTELAESQARLAAVQAKLLRNERERVQLLQCCRAEIQRQAEITAVEPSLGGSDAGPSTEDSDHLSSQNPDPICAESNSLQQQKILKTAYHLEETKRSKSFSVMGNLPEITHDRFRPLDKHQNQQSKSSHLSVDVDNSRQNGMLKSPSSPLLPTRPLP